LSAADRDPVAPGHVVGDADLVSEPLGRLSPTVDRRSAIYRTRLVRYESPLESNEAHRITYTALCANVPETVTPSKISDATA